MASAVQSASDSGAQYSLNENVARDLVRYVRSNTIRNEQQFLLLTLSYASGLFDDTHDYVSTVTIGTSSGGKSHLKDKVDAIFDEIHVMDASTGTDKVLVHSDEWDEADIISMGELQQPPEEMIEFLKRAHGGDEEVVVRNTRGNPNEGFEEEVIRKKAKSYHFTYAQFSADFEFWNRLLKIPVHESESKNRAVGKMQAGYKNITVGDGHVQYNFQFADGTRALQAHMADVKRDAPKRAVLPTSEEYDWSVWEVLEPIFKHGRSEVNRIYSMVFNLVKASALVSYKHRETTTVEVEDEGSVRQEEAIIVAPQDVANVVRCLRALRATTHEIDQKKRAIVDAIRAKSGHDDIVEGVGPIRAYIKEADAPEVKKDELENILQDLEDNFLIDITEGAGEGGKDLYRAFQWDALGRPRVAENADIFADCIDPLTGEDFLDVWDDERARLETTAQDMLKSADIDDGSTSSQGAGVSTSSSPATDDGDAGLSSFGAGASTDDEPVLEEWVSRVGDRIAPVLDGRRIEDLRDVPIEAFLGLTSITDPDVSEVDPAGTMLDPDHDVWDQPDQPDSWVETETQARRTLQEGVDELIDANVINFETVHETDDAGRPVDATVSVDEEVL